MHPLHKSRTISSIVMATTALMLPAICPAAGGHADWGYAGDIGPERWGDLSPEYEACGDGVNQSPVDIVDTIDANLMPLQFDYRSRSTEIVNNGHTLQINAEPGSKMMLGDEILQLEQLHFHSPSEHRIDGELFPLEAHLVHRDARGFLAVVGILFREGTWNKDLEKIGSAAPKAGERAAIDIDFEALQLYRQHKSYYRYSGSLTTPPCTEGVRWFLLKQSEYVAPEQAANFVDWIGEDARGPQPLNARVILEH
jgi:carbonic anhydrase